MMLAVEGPGGHLFPALAFEDFVISAPALCRQEQVDLREFKASLVYMASARSARATW